MSELKVGDKVQRYNHVKFLWEDQREVLDEHGLKNLKNNPILAADFRIKIDGRPDVQLPLRFRSEDASFDEYRDSQFQICTHEQRVAVVAFLDAQRELEEADGALREVFHMHMFEFLKANDFEGAKNSMRGCPNSPAKIMIFRHILLAEESAKRK